MEFLDVIQYIGALGFIVSLAPQLFRTIQRRSAADVSLMFLIVLLASSVLLLYWAVETGSIGLAVSYGANLVVWGVVLYFRLKPASPEVKP